MPLGEALRGGGKYFAFESVGDEIEGTVIGADMRPWTDINGEKGTWDNGDPKMQAVVTIKTNLRDPEIDADDGSRTVYIKWWGQPRQALQQAVRATTGHLPEEQRDILSGGYFKARRTEDLPPVQKGFSPGHTYEYTYRPPSSGLGKAVRGGGPTEAPKAQAQVPATTNYTAPVQLELPIPPSIPVQQPSPVTSASVASAAQNGAPAGDPMEIIRKIQAMHRDFGMTADQISGVVPQYSRDAIAAILVA